MATTVTATKAPSKVCTSSNRRRLDPAKKKLNGTIKFIIHRPSPTSTLRVKKSFTIQASKDPQIEDQGSTTDNNSGSGFTFQDDLNYMLKLGVGSVIGAAVIKYGSIIFPEVTRPNIVQALIMVSTLVIVSVILLATRGEQQR